MLGGAHGWTPASVAAARTQKLDVLQPDCSHPGLCCDHCTTVAAGTGVSISYSIGMDILGQIHYDWPLESALQACEGADAAIVVVGSSMIENERTADGKFRPAHEGEGLDRTDLHLPGRQADLIQALAKRAPGLPLVMVLMHGGGLDVGWVDRSRAVAAMLAVSFPGQVSWCIEAPTMTVEILQWSI